MHNSEDVVTFCKQIFYEIASENWHCKFKAGPQFNIYCSSITNRIAKQYDSLLNETYVFIYIGQLSYGPYNGGDIVYAVCKTWKITKCNPLLLI